MRDDTAATEGHDMTGESHAKKGHGMKDDSTEAHEQRLEDAVEDAVKAFAASLRLTSFPDIREGQRMCDGVIARIGSTAAAVYTEAGKLSPALFFHHPGGFLYVPIGRFIGSVADRKILNVVVRAFVVTHDIDAVILVFHAHVALAKTKDDASRALEILESNGGTCEGLADVQESILIQLECRASAKKRHWQIPLMSDGDTVTAGMIREVKNHTLTGTPFGPWFEHPEKDGAADA